jgi:hypothetical protein
MDPANRFAKSNRQIELPNRQIDLPNGFGKSIRQMDPANRIGEFESPIRFGKSNCRTNQANGSGKSGKSICQIESPNRIA